MSKENRYEKQYTFHVGFKVTIIAISYEDAVIKAERLYPDRKNKTTFIVPTEEVEFFPTNETLELLHKQKKCKCYEQPNLDNVNNRKRGKIGL